MYIWICPSPVCGGIIPNGYDTSFRIVNISGSSVLFALFFSCKVQGLDWVISKYMKRETERKETTTMLICEEVKTFHSNLKRNLFLALNMKL